MTGKGILHRSWRVSAVGLAIAPCSRGIIPLGTIIMSLSGLMPAETEASKWAIWTMIDALPSE